jgi:F420-0:gamma-glutamyl ligase-like protein
MDAQKKEKKPEIEFSGERFLRIPIKTHVITNNDEITDVVTKYTEGKLKKDDIVFITEKAVAITQERAYPVKDIRPSRLAVFLSSHVTKTKAGIGLGIPETMEMALRECGALRILLASAVGAFGKLIGRKGDFYRVAGYRASSIDGPTHNTLPPYNTYVVLGPLYPDRVAKEVSSLIGHDVIIVDLNDLGGKILGRSSRRIDKERMFGILRDNPLGQSREQTPIGIIRKIG